MRSSGWSVALLLAGCSGDEPSTGTTAGDDTARTAVPDTGRDTSPAAATADTAPMGPTGGSTADTATRPTADTAPPTATAATADTGTPSLVTVPIDQADVHLVGRWNVDDPAAPWCAWQGCTVALRFQGTEVSMTLDPGATSEWFRVLVDGEDHGRIELSAGPQSVVLATGLAPGEHDLEMVRETYRGTNWVLTDITVRGAGLVTPLPRPPRRFVFYGDSNLAGDSLLSERDAYGWDTIGTHFGLAGVLSRRFDADYHNISVSGETVPGMRGLLLRADWWSPLPEYDTSLFPADVVVVNLGANDVGRPEAAIRSDMRLLWADVRAAHPDAHIVIANGFGWAYDEPATFTSEVAQEVADPNLSVVHFPWLFEQWHGCEYDHAGMADVLARHLETELGWVAAPSDVMVGFSVGGQVANGSFEEIAPFGGFGWRYADAPGVQRVVDPAGAHDGDTYLSLADGASVHQPLPAANGDAMTAELWAYGEQGGEVLRLVWDVRDGAMFTTPLASAPTSRTLVQGWQRVTHESVAPVDTPRPVVHTRLTVGVDPGDTVRIDQIVTTVGP